MDRDNIGMPIEVDPNPTTASMAIMKNTMI
jgi:hypothetical protein